MCSLIVPMGTRGVGVLFVGVASRDELLAARKMHAARGSAAAKPTLSPALFESAVTGVFARTFARGSHEGTVPRAAGGAVQGGRDIL